MKLYEVTMTAKILVGADNENQAWMEADSWLSKAMSEGGVMPEVDGAREITRVEDIPEDWKGCLVYHAGRGDIAAESFFKPAPPPDPNQITLPWPVPG